VRGIDECRDVGRYALPRRQQMVAPSTWRSIVSQRHTSDVRGNLPEFQDAAGRTCSEHHEDAKAAMQAGPDFEMIRYRGWSISQQSDRVSPKAAPAAVATSDAGNDHLFSIDRLQRI
jgi:hypothetical protein